MTMVNKYNFDIGKDGQFEYDGFSYYHSEFNPEWLCSLNIDPKVIFDVGAHYGGDSLRLKLRFPKSSVYAFEASSEVYTTLKKTEKYGIVTNCIAISRSEGDGCFYTMTVNNCVYGGSLLRFTNQAKVTFDHVTFSDSPVRVKTVTIRRYCQDNAIQNIDLLHMDVEGAVIEVIEGLGEIRPKLINAEIAAINGMVENFNAVEVDRHIKDRGYELIYEGHHDNLYMDKKGF